VRGALLPACLACAAGIEPRVHGVPIQHAGRGDTANSRAGVYPEKLLLSSKIAPG